MRVLIDECVDPRVKLLFGDHRVATVQEQGWDTFEDGPLLTVAQKDFDVLLTIDPLPRDPEGDRTKLSCKSRAEPGLRNEPTKRRTQS
jgi:hypothetical protein